MQKSIKSSLLLAGLGVAVLFGSTACTRIETGHVGVRVGFDKTINKDELQPGTFNQTLIGSVLTFPVKDMQADVTDLMPLAADNSTIADFDVAVIYNVTPTAVADIWSEKNRSFHLADDNGNIYLMYNYVYQLARNAAYKSARKYESLKMSDNRPLMEQEIRALMTESLAGEGLQSSITINQVLIRNIMPDKRIVDSANELVKSQNELKQKTIEVETARKEAERIAVLNENKGAIEYMNAMANMKIAEGIAAGKVQTIVVPYDFKGIVNANPPQTP